MTEPVNPHPAIEQSVGFPSYSTKLIGLAFEAVYASCIRAKSLVSPV